MTEATPVAPPERWALVELMGHRRRAGRISEVAEFGAVMLRIEIPQADGSFVEERYGGSAIFCLRPCSEAAARSDVEVYSYEYRSAGLLAAPEVEADEADFAEVDPDHHGFDPEEIGGADA